MLRHQLSMALACLSNGRKHVRKGVLGLSSDDLVSLVADGQRLARQDTVFHLHLLLQDMQKS